MMLLILDDEHKKHLQFLTTVPENVLDDFCRISSDFILKGSNQKIYQNAAQKLEVDANLVRNGVEGLMYLFVESAKLMLNELDFQDSILAVGFPEAHQRKLLDYYRQNVPEWRTFLNGMTSKMTHYRDMEWRCDVQLASRSLRHQVTPLLTLKLTTSTGDSDEENKVRCLQTDLTNLVHMTEVLEQALRENETQHCRRLRRYIK